MSNELFITEIHSRDEAHLTRALDIDETGMVLQRSPSRTPVGQHVWLEFVLPQNPHKAIRVLAKIVGRSADTTRLTFKHVWPADRQTWFGFVNHALAA